MRPENFLDHPWKRHRSQTNRDPRQQQRQRDIRKPVRMSHRDHRQIWNFRRKPERCHQPIDIRQHLRTGEKNSAGNAAGTRSIFDQNRIVRRRAVQWGLWRFPLHRNDRLSVTPCSQNFAEKFRIATSGYDRTGCDRGFLHRIREIRKRDSLPAIKNGGAGGIPPQSFQPTKIQHLTRCATECLATRDPV